MTFGVGVIVCSHIFQYITNTSKMLSSSSKGLAVPLGYAVEGVDVVKWHWTSSVFQFPERVFWLACSCHAGCKC